MTEGEDEPEFKVGQQFSESNKFSLCKDLEGYRCLWGNLFVRLKQAAKRWQSKGLEGKQKRTTKRIVQSLNSPFLPPHIGAQPGRAKEESRITCMRMLRTTPFFPPKSGEKPYLEVVSRFALWRDFLNDNIQATKHVN